MLARQLSRPRAVRLATPRTSDPRCERHLRSQHLRDAVRTSCARHYHARCRVAASHAQPLGDRWACLGPDIANGERGAQCPANNCACGCKRTHLCTAALDLLGTAALRG